MSTDYAYELRLRVVSGEDGPTAILELPADWSPFLNDVAGQFVQEVTRRLRTPTPDA